MKQRQRQWWDPVVDYEVEMPPEIVAAQVRAQWQAWQAAQAAQATCPVCARPVADHSRRELRACDNSRIPYEVA